jgi:hypothetical protein
MDYKKANALATDGELVELESVKNGVKKTRTLPFKEVPMNLKINGKNVTKSLAEVVELLYGEINSLREELKQVQSSLMVADEKLNSKLKKIAEQVDKITVHLNQEGSVVGW